MRNLIYGASALAFVLATMTPVHADTKENTKKIAVKKAPVQQGKATAQRSTKEVYATKSKKKGLGLEISGETSVNFYAFKNKSKEESGGKGRGTHVAADDSRINFEVFGKATEGLGGLEYSFLVGITADADAPSPIQENRIKLKGQWGTFLGGCSRGVTDFMSVGTFFFLGGTGGILGNYKAVINETTGSVIRDDLINKFTMKDQTKLTYVTPRAYGFQLGYSYTPDGAHKGEQNLASHTPTSAGVKSYDGVRFAGYNFHELGLNYKKNFYNCFDVAVSATGLVGKMRDLRRTLAGKADIDPGLSLARRNLNAYAFGAVIEYAGFSIGGEYLNNLKSGQLKDLKGADLGKVSTIGAGYKFGANALSLAYLHSKRNLGRLEKTTAAHPRPKDYGHVKADNVSLTYDRELAPGLAAYIEGVSFKMKASNQADLKDWNNINGFKDETVKNNRGQAAITGLRIKF